MQFDTGEINIICTDMERSLRFYQDILGFECIEQEGIAARLRYGPTTLLLLPVADKPLPQRRYCSIPTISLDLMVEDVEAAADYLHEHKVTFEEEVDPNLRRCIIRDPDGLFLEIIERTK